MPRKTNKKMKKNKPMPVIHRDHIQKSYPQLVTMIQNGEIPVEDWEYYIRKMGYSTRVINEMRKFEKWKF